MTNSLGSATDAPDAAPKGDPYKTLVRIIAGGIGEGIDRLMEVSATLDDVEISTDPDASGPYATNPVAMAVVGFAYDFPEQVAEARAALDRALSPFSTITRAVIDAGSSVAESTGIGPFITEATLPTREALADEYQRLISIGTAEYARGRVLAVGTFTESIDGIVGYLGNSEEVGELVREQTLGVTGAAVLEIRETGAAADGLTEGIFRKIFRRDPQPLPPKPGFETG
ncbi:MAG: hypothetical protein M3132_07480 [Actinomycetia bacterium]|nr:hypothetical protein [Actinomycetes bacterium]